MNIAPLISLGEIKDIIKELWHDFKPLIFLNQYEKGVILRAGKLKKVMKKGINPRIPFWDDYHTVFAEVDTLATTAVHITTLDDKTVTALPIVEFVIEDEVKYILETNDARSNLHDKTRAIVSDYLTDCTWEECKLKRTANAITRKISEECKEMGIKIIKVMLSDMCVSRVIITQI